MVKLITKEKNMLLVLFFILLILIIIILTGTIKTKVFEVDISGNNAKFNVQIGIYLFNKIKIFSSKINEKKLEKLSNSKFALKFNNFNFNKIPIKTLTPKRIKEYLKILNINLEKLNLNIEIDTENILIATFLIPTISSFLAIILSISVKKYKEENYYYNIKPLYKGKNQIKLLRKLYNFPKIGTYYSYNIYFI